MSDISSNLEQFDLSQVVILPLTASTPEHLLTGLGKLYKLLVPEREESAVKLGSGFQSASVTLLEKTEELSIDNPIYPFKLAILQIPSSEGDITEHVIGYSQIQYEFYSKNIDNNEENRTDTNDKDNIDQLDSATLHYPSTAYCFIMTHPNYRRKGVGKKLLHSLRYQLQHHKPFNGTTINSIFFFADSEESSAFLLDQGGDLTEYGHTYELELLSKKDLPDPLHFPESYSMEILVNPKADQLVDFIRVFNLAKQTEPRGNDERYQPTTAQDFLRNAMKYAHTLLVAKLYHNESVVGVSDLIETGLEGRVFQRFTGIHPDYRGQGLAKILKNNILQWLVHTHPEYLPITVETSTLDENKAMIAVNKSVGYYKTGFEQTIEFYRK